MQQLIEFYEERFSDLAKWMGRSFDTPQDGEDVVQEAFIKAIKYWPSYEPDRTEISVWFTSILLNCLRTAKTCARRQGMSEDKVPVEEDDEVEPFDKTVGLRQALRLARSKKSPESEVLILYFSKGYKPREISEILNVKSGVVRNWVCNFRKEVLDGI